MILSLETSTDICSVALHNKGELLSYFELKAEKSHSEQITELIKTVVSFAKVELHQLSAIAISQGPGSYTGLRIASSTAKGLCFALEIPLISVDTLQAMALGYAHLGKIVCPLLDARRLEVFCGFYDKNNIPMGAVESKILEQGCFDVILDTNEVVFIGNAVKKSIPFIQHPNAFLIEGVQPSAKYIGALAYQKFVNNDLADVVNFEPFYLKEFYFGNAKSLND